MDTEKKKKAVGTKLEEIRDSMPLTYAEIKRYAAGEMGNLAYELVRRGLRDEAGCFYACERIRQEGKLDRWIVAGCGFKMPGLTPEQLERELNTPDVINLIFVLRDPEAVNAGATS